MVLIAVLFTHYMMLTTIINKVNQLGAMPTAKELVDLSLKPLLFVIPMVFILFAILLVYLIFLTHRTAGPLHQLKNAMSRVSQGDFSVRVKFRRADEIKDVEDSFNQMVEKLKSDKEKRK
jgi:nitrogen fixation/metabolism regulation signal transduction histidine kinase